MPDRTCLDCATPGAFRGPRTVRCIACTKKRANRKLSARGPEFACWKNMKHRCSANSIPQWIRDYYSRGIRVCERWSSFANFISDMGPRPGAGYSLDRIDNDKGYEPGNCRWATVAQQLANRRITRFVTAFGETLPMGAWAAKLSMHKSTLKKRLDSGMQPELALSKPIAPRSKRRWGASNDQST